MVNDNHPITPPPELLKRWREEAPRLRDCGVTREEWIATQAYRAGADQELDACCEVLARELICDGKHVATDLRAARRPEPPSLKEQAYNALDTYIYGEPDPNDKERTYNIIRRALESLSE